MPIGEKTMVSITDIHTKGCSFSWEKLREMKENKIEFWAADGLTRLRILEADVRGRKIYMITNKGEKTWPLTFQKLEEVHNKIHNAEIPPIPYEIDKYVPMWGGYITGLLRHLGCMNT
jgi:hypothetical protein